MYDSKYIAKQPDENGYIHYTAEEHQIWQDLYQQQIRIIPNRACQEYLQGLDILQMSADRIPQCLTINNALNHASHFAVQHVPALIGFEKFFSLLAQRKFPAASFIRTRADFKYIQEPDIFHEYFGHCPMLTDLNYANFMAQYGQLAQQVSHKQQVLLARLYWFTVEFGLINTTAGLRIYGGGILSSPEETLYALTNTQAERKPFDVLDALRTPYLINIKQPIYFVIDDYQQLYELPHSDLLAVVNQAIKLGDLPPAY